MLLNLVNHSRPDIANAGRELSKLMNSSTTTGMEELKRVIKYMLDISQYGLKLVPTSVPELCIIIMYTDID